MKNSKSTKEKEPYHFTARFYLGIPEITFSASQELAPQPQVKCSETQLTVEIAGKLSLRAYKDQFGEDYEELALENARLLWIRRKPGEIWEPPVEKSDEI